MEKETFLTLLKNYTSLTQAEVFELISIQSKYPYSQVIHNLCSRAALDLKLDAREHLLHTSAIYATERSVLKGIMSAPKEERIVPEIAIAEVSVETHESLPAVDGGIPEPKISAIDEPELKGDALIQDLMKEIDKLRVSQEKFETTVREFDRINSGATESELKKKIKKVPENDEPSDSLIEEIKNKKKVKPDGPKQKEQIEIIENFIRSQPTINKNKLIAQPTESTDLAEKSLLYGDNIVSETLVEILLKQGKKDKAIEVLKKLIWKFPQKKAYFAAQIEDLKK